MNEGKKTLIKGAVQSANQEISIRVKPDAGRVEAINRDQENLSHYMKLDDGPV